VTQKNRTATINMTTRNIHLIIFGTLFNSTDYNTVFKLA